MQMRIIFSLLLLSLSFDLFATPPQPPQFLKINPVKLLTLKPGKKGEATVSISIEDIFHIQSNPVSQPNLIPTTLTISSKDGLEAGTIVYPAGKKFRLENSDKDLSVYEGNVEIKVAIRAKSAKAGKYELLGSLKFQPCNDKICFFPNKKEVKIPVQVLKH